MGINKASLPDILDQNGNPVMMTMNGIPIDITDLKVLSYLKKLSKYSPDVTMDAFEEISKAIKFYEDFRFTQTGEPFKVIQMLQAIQIQVQNKMVANRSRISESLNDYL